MEATRATPLLGLEDRVCCFLVKHHSASGGKRWDRITRGVNRALNDRAIPAEDVRTFLAQHGGVKVPACWIEEGQRNRLASEAQIERRRQRAERAEKRRQEAQKTKTSTRKPVSSRAGDNAKIDMSEAEEVDTPSDVTTDSDVADLEVGSGDEKPTKKTAEKARKVSENSSQALSKFEVFACMPMFFQAACSVMMAGKEARQDVARAVGKFNELYADVPAELAVEMSREERVRRKLPNDSLAYGEIDGPAFINLLVKCRYVYGHMRSEGGIFWDLGSGSGKAVLAAAYVHDFARCCGIEALDGLKTLSEEALVRSKGAAGISEFDARRVKVLFASGDFCGAKRWQDEATVLLVHANLSTSQAESVRKRCDEMKRGSLCISISRPAVGDALWGLLGREAIQTSWGLAQVYLHEKLADGSGETSAVE